MATLWVESVLVTAASGRSVAVMAGGVFGFGILIVPMAMLATLHHCQWERFLDLLFFGVRKLKFFNLFRPNPRVRDAGG